jgi:hypothetical protein
MRKELKTTKDLAAYQLETRFLSVFDYAFNGRMSSNEKSSDGTNPPKRYLWVKKPETCCFCFQGSIEVDSEQYVHKST